MTHALLVFTPEHLAELSTSTGVRFGQPLAVYLAHGTGHAHRYLRELIEAWVRKYPDAARRRLIPRLQDTNDINCRAALCELFTFAYLSRNGRPVEHETPVGNGDADFLVENDIRVRLEVATVFPTTEHQERVRHINELLAAIDKLDAGDGCLSLNLLDWPPTGLTARMLAQQVRRYLHEIAQDPHTGPLVVESLHVEYRPGIRASGPIGSIGYPFGFHGTAEEARRKIKRKANKFRALKGCGEPFVLVLFDGGLSQDFHRAVDWILFGSPELRMTRRAGLVTDTEVGRTPEGFFGPRGGSTHISAVLGCSYHLFDTGIYLCLKMWHNPRAETPLPEDFFGPVPQLVAHERSDDGFTMRWTRPGKKWVRLWPQRRESLHSE